MPISSPQDQLNVIERGSGLQNDFIMSLTVLPIRSIQPKETAMHSTLLFGFYLTITHCSKGRKIPRTTVSS